MRSAYTVASVASMRVAGCEKSRNMTAPGFGSDECGAGCGHSWSAAGDLLDLSLTPYLCLLLCSRPGAEACRARHKVGQRWADDRDWFHVSSPRHDASRACGNPASYSKHSASKEGSGAGPQPLPSPSIHDTLGRHTQLAKRNSAQTSMSLQPVAQTPATDIAAYTPVILLASEHVAVRAG